MKVTSGIALTLIGLLVSVGNLHAAPTYSLTSIDTSTLNNPYATAYINDLGEIAVSNGVRSATGNWSYLNPIGSFDSGPGYSYVTGINNLGQTVGSSTTTGMYMGAVVWNGTTPTGIDDGAARGSTLTDINDHGQWVGYAENHQFVSPLAEGLTLGSATYYERATLQGLNDMGVAVGQAITHEQIPAAQAILWSVSGMQLLDNRVITDVDNNIVAYWQSIANDLNNAGQVIGQAEYETGMHATLWENGSMLDLGTLGASDYSNAYKINEAGIAVGDSNDRAVSFHAGQVLDLNLLVDPAILASGWILSKATDINELGWIVGIMNNTLSGQSQLFLLKPMSAVPELSTWLMMLVGVMVAWRRRPAS
jgi:probable HAF family extracellular repeat protein